jgi:hypothetical protein
MIVKIPLGVISNVIIAQTGIDGDTDLAAEMAIRASFRSVIVSTQIMSTPAETTALICLSNPAWTASREASP